MQLSLWPPWTLANRSSPVLTSFGEADHHVEVAAVRGDPRRAPSAPRRRTASPFRYLVPIAWRLPLDRPIDDNRVETPPLTEVEPYYAKVPHPYRERPRSSRATPVCLQSSGRPDRARAGLGRPRASFAGRPPRYGRSRLFRVR